MRVFAAVLAAAVLVPAALAAVPAKGAKFRGSESPATAMTIAKTGRAIATLKLAPKRQPAACRLKNPILTAIKIAGSGAFVYKATVPSASGKKIALTVKGEFQTDYLAQLTATYTGPGCKFAYSDALVKI